MGTSAETSKTPKRIGGFELLGRLGHGAMGVVYKARQLSLDRDVALKIVKPELAKDQTFLERFQREARASAKLNHPNIVHGIDVGRDEASGLWYFAMEYVHGRTLKELLEEQRVLPEHRALAIVLKVAEALECAGRQQIVHRDIKPDNIMLTPKDEVKLMDLGLARRFDADAEDAHLTQSGKAVGTPFYMAPEQIRGEQDLIDQRTDLYALGATLFHLVTGRVPFEGATGPEIMARHLTEPAPRASKVNPAVSDACSSLIAKLMQKEPKDRFQSASALAKRVNELLDAPERSGRHPARRSTTGPRAPIRGSQTARVPLRAVTTGPRAPVSERQSARPGREASSSPMLAIVAFAAVLAIVAGVLLMSGRKAPRRAERPVEEPLPAAPAAQPEPKRQTVIEHPAVTPNAPATAPTSPAIAEPAKEVKPAEQPEPVANAEPAAPAPQAPTPPTPDEVAMAAYARFQKVFFASLRLGKREDAEKRLVRAEGDPELAPMKEELVFDRKALDWPAAFEKGFRDGAKKLMEQEVVELLLESGKPMRAGKNEAFQILSVSEEAVVLGGKGLEMPVPFEKLHPEMRRRLAAGELSATGGGMVVFAFQELLHAADAEAPGRIRSRLDQAAAAGAAQAEVGYVRRALEGMESELREQAAASAWASIEKASQGEEWPKERKKEIVELLDDFENRHGATAFATTKKNEIAALRKLAADRGGEIAREGLAVWLRADEGVQLAGDAVAVWKNQAGNDWHAVTMKESTRPVLVPNALGKRPALRFDGKDDHLLIPQVKGEMRSFSILWTLYPVSRSNWNQSISAGNGWGEFVFHTTREGGVYVGTSVASRISPNHGPGNNTVVLNEWQQFAYVFDEGKARFYKNGKLLAERKLQIAAWDGFRIGGYTGGQTIHGDIGELLIYTRALSDEERTKAEQHLLPPPQVEGPEF